MLCVFLDTFAYRTVSIILDERLFFEEKDERTALGCGNSFCLRSTSKAWFKGQVYLKHTFEIFCKSSSHFQTRYEIVNTNFQLDLVKYFTIYHQRKTYHCYLKLSVNRNVTGLAILSLRNYQTYISYRIYFSQLNESYDISFNRAVGVTRSEISFIG